MLSPDQETLTCPTCGAGDQREARCRRCRTDLGLLWTLREARAAELQRVAAALAEERWGDALAAARHAELQRRDVGALRLVAVCELLAGQFEAAVATHRQAQSLDRNG